MHARVANSDQRSRRNSLRLRGYDYGSSGVYFVTLCLRDRLCLLGKVAQDQMRLNRFGLTVAECWERLPLRYPHVELDEWIVMPNHLHGIIAICEDAGGSRPAPTSPDAGAPDVGARVKLLGQLLGAFKTTSARRINQMRGTPGASVWQRNYFDHIVRTDQELERIRSYIAENPAKWSTDRENPAAGNIEDFL